MWRRKLLNPSSRRGRMRVTTYTIAATRTTTVAIRKTARTSVDVGRIDQVVRAGPPCRGDLVTVAPHLVLPDRRGRLQRVDREPSGVERLRSVRRAHDRHDRALAELDPSRPVEEHDPPELRPSPSRFVGDRSEAGGD